MLLHMTNNATGSGMGTAGLVGPLMTWQVMIQTEDPMVVLVKIIVISCTSGSDHTWNFGIYEKEGLDSPGRHETGAVGRKWITEIGKILLQ